MSASRGTKQPFRAVRLGLSELIAETDIPTVAHHHDFVWERPRFLANAAA